jgi:glycosyltransferase involved in cell wall biosynthesis
VAGPPGSAAPQPTGRRTEERSERGATRSIDLLHVTQCTDGGVAAYVTAAATDQLARGWTVAVASPEGGRLPADLAARGIRWLHWPAQRSPHSAAAEAVLLSRAIRSARPRLVHLHSAKAGLAGRLAVRGRLPTLFQPHGWSWLAVRGLVAGASLRWERAAARWTDLIVCVGTGEAAHGQACGVRGRYAVVRNGVDLDRFRPVTDGERLAIRAQLGIDPDAPLAVCVGRVTPQKGQDVLVAAWPLVQQRQPDAQLCLVGDGDLVPRIRARCPAGVRLCGAVEDVRPWYAAADLVALPSRWEGLPLTLVEALACGRPVVASAVPGLADVLPAGAGAVVPPEDPVALAAAIVQRLDDRGRLRAESRAAARCAAGFGARRTFEELAAVTDRTARAWVGAAGTGSSRMGHGPGTR